MALDLLRLLIAVVGLRGLRLVMGSSLITSAAKPAGAQGRNSSSSPRGLGSSAQVSICVKAPAKEHSFLEQA